MNTDLSQAHWFKSSRSGGSKECVEVAFLADAVAVRDSKHLAGPALIFAAAEWDSFAAAAEAGVFDHDR
ncbi:DUF397 domain-containing protein [Nocardia sp. NBC_01503]|uniref:DUF397 domain-containing protein n=1 Tax=Nocardia sp. NBC_01503 TaxID=2975997 RepID=UPI002E7C2C64|nr:DUF397 domain-containing protein [Nocardia sp. NBC_01503]WTL29981.1 DUF397 domain-containing protein [Nocardia sp. NBC_01503]